MNPVTAPPTESITRLLDREVALARAGGDAVLLREIATLFLENYQEWMTELRDSIRRDDAQAIARSAHGIKGSVANFGATEAVEAAWQLEQVSRDRDLIEVAKALDSLELALAALHPELEAL